LGSGIRTHHIGANEFLYARLFDDQAGDEKEQSRKTWLYNRNDDATEQHYLSETHTERLEKDRRALYDMDRQMVEPLWPMWWKYPSRLLP
jgi:hypothetical protein